MKMNNKKGLSDIVATVLIVLLALAAVAIVWGFLRPVFDTAAKETDLKSRCFSVDVQPTLCTYTNVVSDEGALVVTAMARNMAGESTSITAVLNTIAGATAASQTLTGDGVPALLGTTSFDLHTTGESAGIVSLDDLGVTENPDVFVSSEAYKLLDNFMVAGVVSDGTGSEEACPGTAIACTYVPANCDLTHCYMCELESVPGTACTAAGCSWDDVEDQCT